MKFITKIIVLLFLVNMKLTLTVNRFNNMETLVPKADSDDSLKSKY